MRPLPTAAALLAICIGMAACGERRDAERAEPHAGPVPSARTTLPEGAPFRFADDGTPEGFAQRMVMSDLLEIASSRLALERAGSAPVRDFAQAMVDAHVRSSEELTATLEARDLSPPLPSALDPDHQRRLNDLTAAPPEDFERVYLDLQTTAHQAALDELEDYADAGGDAALKAWAGKSAPVVRDHLERARILDRRGADRTATPGVEPLAK